TYHDPCYLGRHNRIFEAPRALLEAVTGAAAAAEDRFVERDLLRARSLCSGAGGSRMWMEERIGKRINIERAEEAVRTGARTVAAACPFCLTMLTDALTAQKSNGLAEDVEVVDVATVLLRAVKPG